MCIYEYMHIFLSWFLLDMALEGDWRLKRCVLICCREFKCCQYITGRW